MSITDSYIMMCAKEYAKRNPDEKVVITHKSDVLGCDYCRNDKKMFEFDKTELEIFENKLVIKSADEMFSIDIDYCPVCGNRLMKAIT